jgi:hypothetical protein
MYKCEILSGGKQIDGEYETLFTGTIDEQFKMIEVNLEKLTEIREKMKEESETPCDPSEIRYFVNINGYIDGKNSPLLCHMFLEYFDLECAGYLRFGSKLKHFRSSFKLKY